MRSTTCLRQKCTVLRPRRKPSPCRAALVSSLFRISLDICTSYLVTLLQLLPVVPSCPQLSSIQSQFNATPPSGPTHPLGRLWEGLAASSIATRDSKLDCDGDEDDDTTPEMPVRARSKVVKIAVASNASSASNAGRRSVSRNSSFSSVAQEQLEQLAQDAASNVAVDARDLKASIARDEEDDNSAIGVGLNSEAMLSNNSGMLHNALDATPEATPFPTPINQTTNPPTRTAGDVALGIYGDSIKIDSALCKKLACEEALRDPGQRRTGQKLNMERRSNVEAMLAHVTGVQVARPCKNCHKGHGPWNQCVVYDGQMCGSCTNCWFNASGARCTFHGQSTLSTCFALTCFALTFHTFNTFIPAASQRNPRHRASRPVASSRLPMIHCPT